MPRLTISHDKIVRIVHALIADTRRRRQLAVDMPDDATMHLEVCAENERIVSAFNVARGRDGLTAISYRGE